MSNLARHISNNATGDRIIFIRSPMLGDGEILEFRGILPGHAAGAPLHQHDAMVETFMVESGMLEIDLGDGEAKFLLPGESLTVQPGTRHGFRNPLASETRFVTTATPGMGLEEFLRTVYTLGNDQSGGLAATPRKVLQFGSVMARTDMVIAGLPRGLQRLIWDMTAAIASLFAINDRPAAVSTDRHGAVQ